MFFILSKIFFLFTHPFTWILIAFGVAYFTRKPHLSRFSFRAAIAGLLIFSNSVIFLEFARMWETEGTKISEVEHYDCAIVLGGMSAWDNTHKRLSIRRGGDRIWQAINLYHLGKVDRLLISGAHGHLVDKGLNEAQQMRTVLLENGIPDSVILIEDVSRNTHENAVESKKVIDSHPEIESVLLVTSALHMRRARACFEKAGFEEFDCFTTDHFTGANRGYGYDQYLIPNVSNLSNWEKLNKEWIGYLVYWVMGYI